MPEQLTDEQLAEWEREADGLVTGLRAGRVDGLLTAVPLLVRALREARDENRQLRSAIEDESARVDSYQERCGELTQELDDLTGRFRESPHLAPKYYARAKTAETERDALRDENERLHLDREALSVRLTLARNALIATGYFTADQVGDDVAPRITEMFAALAAPTGQEAQE